VPGVRVSRTCGDADVRAIAEARDGDLMRDAAEIALDRARFQRELADRAHASRVRDDFRGGVRSGVNGTPTFFINGFRHDGPWDLHTLLDALEARSSFTAGELRRSGTISATGGSPPPLLRSCGGQPSMTLA
jgi:hypothetical protein